MKHTQTWLSSALGLLWLTSSAVGLPAAFAQAEKETSPEDSGASDAFDIGTPVLLEDNRGDSEPSLFEVTNTVSGLLEPLDLVTETERALSGAGRTDPFKPANQTTSLPALPALPNSSEGQVPLPTLPDTDPAEFARSVRVTGIVRVGTENFVLLESPNTVADAIPEGGFYETVQVASISVNSGEVVLQEGGQTVVRFVE